MRDQATALPYLMVDGRGGKNVVGCPKGGGDFGAGKGWEWGKGGN